MKFIVRIAYLVIIIVTQSPKLQAESVNDSSTKLKEIFTSDQNDRLESSNENVDWHSVSKRDKVRREQVQSIMSESGLKTAEDYYHAAMVFQHGSSSDDIKLAFSLAWIASTMDREGKTKARWLSAAAWDRIMMHKNQPQWYGTQYSVLIGGETGTVYELYKVDETIVSDEERAKMNVPTLEKSKERVMFLNRKNKTPI